MIKRSLLIRGNDLTSGLRHDTPAFLASYYYTLKCPDVNTLALPYSVVILKEGTRVDILTCEHDVPILKPHDKHLVLVQVEESAVTMVQSVRSWGSTSSTESLVSQPVTGKQFYVDKKAVQYLVEQDEERRMIFEAGPQTPAANHDFEYTMPVGCEAGEKCCKLGGELSQSGGLKPTYYKCAKSFLPPWMRRCIQADDWACSHEYEDYVKAQAGDSNGSDSNGSDGDDDVGMSLGALNSTRSVDLSIYSISRNATRSLDF